MNWRNTCNPLEVYIMIRKIIALILVTLFLLLVLVISNIFFWKSKPVDVGAISAANHLYEAGHYTEAIQIYEQIIAGGTIESSILYNLGNAYYQSGDLGRAVLNYQRAAQLNPRDADILANLSRVRDLTQDGFAAETASPINSMANLTRTWMTHNETAILALILWFVFCVLLLAWRSMQFTNARKGLGYTTLLVLLLVFVSSLSLGSRVYLAQTQPIGVVIAPVVTISTDPGGENATEYALHSGTEVNLLETRGDWIRLTVHGDVIQGWVPLDAVETIDGVQMSL